MDDYLEEIVLMNLHRSFHWNPMDIAYPISAEVSGAEFWDGGMEEVFTCGLYKIQ